MTFPQGFVWGAATAAYQIEGAVNEDGRGFSVWDMFCRRKGAVKNGHSGAAACDHYHRWKEDVALMKDLGLQAYRFSIAWPRVLPSGVGAVNQKGMDFYSRLVDELLSAGIAPYVTLFHWDFPYELYCRGGWLNRESADWFAQYASIVGKTLGDRVRNWMTLNEPACSTILGHMDGSQAPGDKLAPHEVFRVLHHHLLAHGRAVDALRATAKDPQIGWCPNPQCSVPATHSPSDIEAARASLLAVPTDPAELTLWEIRVWTDPVLLGQYPAELLTALPHDETLIRDGDMKIISRPTDFLGVNIYWGKTVRAGEHGPETVPFPPGVSMNTLQWAVTPEVLRWGPRMLYEHYRKPIYITENGYCGADCVCLDGQVHDADRIDYLQRHQIELGKAIADGADIRGNFVWTVMDNFEWAEGYRPRVGLTYVDYPTQKRIIKDSGRWYRRVIETNGASLMTAPGN